MVCTSSEELAFCGERSRERKRACGGDAQRARRLQNMFGGVHRAHSTVTGR